jgi:uncharacterized protein
MIIVIDTNALLTSVSKKSPSYWLYQAFNGRKFQIAITTKIIAEYEEKLCFHWNAFVADAVTSSIAEAPNTLLSEVFFNLHLIPHDPDDNKFVDCAFAANADYLVTNDAHFNVLKKINFPHIRVVSLEDFKQILIDHNLMPV